MTIGATTDRIVYNKSCYTTYTILFMDKHIMNNQQAFSVRVGRIEFVLKALKAYTHYSKLSKEYSTDADKCIDDRDLKNIYREFSSKAFDLSARVKNIISMVNISSDEFVDVTEDVYKLIYKYDS